MSTFEVYHPTLSSDFCVDDVVAQPRSNPLERLPFGPIRPMHPIHAIGFFFGQVREGVWFSVRDDLWWCRRFLDFFLYTLSWSSNCPFLALYLSVLCQVQSSWAFTFWSHSSHACQTGGSQSSSSVAIQSGIFGRCLVMTNLLFKSSLRASTLSAWSLFSPRDFSRVLARLSESGLAPSSSGGREEKTLSCLSSEHVEMSESVEYENERPEAKVLKESSRLRMSWPVIAN